MLLVWFSSNIIKKCVKFDGSASEFFRGFAIYHLPPYHANIPVVSSIVIGALTSPDSLSLGNPPLTQTHFHVLRDLSFVRFGK